MRNTKTVIFIMSFLLLGVSCSKKSHIEILEQEDIASIPDVVIRHFSDASMSASVKNWILKADTAEVYEKQSKTVLSNLQVSLFKNNKEEGLLTAKWGFISSGGKDISAKTNVVYKSKDGFQLYTDSLFWDNSKKYLKTPDFVKIIQPNGDIITGYGLEANQNFSEISILHKVRGKLHKND